MTITPQTTWLVAVQNGQAGPFTLDQMKQHWANGQLTIESYVWREGFDNWKQLGQLEDLQHFDAAAATPAAPAAQPEAQAPPAEDVRETVREQPAEPAHQAPATNAANGPVDFGMDQNDDFLDEVFVEQVKASWKRHRMRELSTEVDEVLVGGVITGVLDNGYSLIDLNSDGTNHYLRFENIQNGDRVIFQLQHLAESLLTSEVLGHQANVTIGFGARVRDFAATWKAVRQEMKGGYITSADPGIITIDGDMTSQYIYVTVGLIWDIDDYLDADDPYKVLYPKLGRDIGGTLHALRKYLRGRFGS